MKNKIKLSIVVPIYNVEKYLKNCIESISSNDNEEIEILLINDGSTDNSEVICKNFLIRDSRIKYFSRKNVGCSATRNFGLKESKGEYIWFIDSDDFIEKNAIDEIMKELNEEKEMLVFGYTNIKNEKKLDRHIPQNIDNKFEICQSDEIFNKPWNKIYNVKILKNNNIFFPENCHMGEDMALNFKYLYFIKNIKVIQKPLYNYVVTNGATSNLNKRKEIFLAFDDIFSFYIKKEEELKNLKKILEKYYRKHAILYPYEMILTSGISDIEKKEKFKELRKELKKRKEFFKTQFLYKQMYYYLKYKLYFIKPYYKKLKKNSFN